MKKIFTSENPFLVQQLIDALDQVGIPHLVKNQFSGGAAGEIPPHECWPEVWLMDESWFPRAQKLLAELQQSSDGQSWICPECSEPNDANFEICWCCQIERNSCQ